MTRMIFINLPVTDVARATAFYQALGFERNEIFSNTQASCMVWSEAIYVMLLDHAFYATFTDKRIIDAHRDTGALLCLTFDSRAAVDAFHDSARKAGGSEPRPVRDQGFMYGGAVDDPDGHGWETVWMDPAAAQAGPPETEPGHAG